MRNDEVLDGSPTNGRNESIHHCTFKIRAVMFIPDNLKEI